MSDSRGQSAAVLPTGSASADRYSLYGLELEILGAVGRLPAPPGRGPAEVTLDLRGFPPSVSLDGADRCYAVDPNGVQVFRLAGSPYFHFRYPEEIEFLIEEGGRRVFGRWPREFTFSYVAPMILGPLMGFLLRTRSVTTLHGSVIEIGGRAVVLIGSGGAGKSTTAAAFARMGYAVASDDLASIRIAGETILVAPGYPRVCLWPASVGLLFGAEEARPLITEGWGKRYLDLNEPGYRFVSHSLPLGAVYWITDRGDASAVPSVQPLEPPQILAALVGNTYGAGFGGHAQSAGDLRTFGLLASRVPVRALVPAAGAVNLEALCRLIAEDSRRV